MVLRIYNIGMNKEAGQVLCCSKDKCIGSYSK